METREDRGATHVVAGMYLVAHVLLFRRVLGPDEPVAAAGLLLLLSGLPGLYLVVTGVLLLRGRAPRALLLVGSRVLLALGALTTAGFVGLASSLVYVWRLANPRNPVLLLALWFAPPVLMLLVGLMDACWIGTGDPQGRT